MIRRLLLLLLALGLWQVAYTQIHCSLEPPDCQEGKCELCHFADIAPQVSGSARLCSPPAAPSPAVAPNQGAPGRPFSKHNRGRAPPR